MKTKRIANSKTTGLTFTLSTPTVDRVGDRVMPQWNLDHFKANPIALFGHMHDAVIGTWQNVRMEGKNLVADLKLAKEGTSPLVDEVRSLIEQGILKAVSIGFSSGKAVENDFGGFDLYDNHLMETSVVAVPANQEALRKSLSKVLPDDQIAQLCSVNGCKGGSGAEGSGTGVQASQTKTKTITTKSKGFKMTFAERIAALQKSVAAKQTQLEGLNAKHDLDDAELDTMAQLTDDIASETARIKKFEAMEKSAGNIVPVKAAPQVPTVAKEDAKDGILKGVIALSKAVADNIGLDVAAEKMYKGDKLAPVFAKAASNPAMTTVPEWAGDLVQDGYASYLEDLVADTIFGSVPGLRLTFGKMGSLTIPYRDGSDTLAGSFVAEGDPIPVKQDKFATVKITPFKMGVISTFTKELMKKSTPTIEGLIRAHMISDTRDVLDTSFLDNNAASAIRPAGIENSAGATNVVASAGDTVADIEKDIQGVFDRFAAKKLGGSGVMVMHPSRKRGLNFKTNALGQYPFRNENLLDGFTVVTSINVPADKVYFIDSKALVFGLEQGVEFDVSSQATLVMGDPAKEISDGTTVADLPIRSLYQTDTLAIKQTLGLTWKQVRDGGVQILTGVSW